MSTAIQIYVYDSLRRGKVRFEPLDPERVTMYLCGPTTYDAAHIGHAYSAIVFDMIRRSLVWLGYPVLFARNVTDVDDKILIRSAATGEPPLSLSARYAEAYNRDMASFGVAPPDIEPRVSEHIDDIIAMIKTILARGAAYEVDGDVYFSVAAFGAYGQLSGQTIAALRAGARIEVDDRKRAPGDFALWKAAPAAQPENRPPGSAPASGEAGVIAWDSPWGKGRPGWHIECSAMTLRHLGETIDIHGGGRDLVFPHHENEIAQSCTATGKDTLARYWMHNGLLELAGEKMSKSLGNVLGCQDIVAEVGGEAVRFFSLTHHYRSPVELEIAKGGEKDRATRFPGLEAADRRLGYFYATLARLDDFLASGKDPDPGPGEVIDPGPGPGEVIDEARALVPAARAALADDFNSPVVLAALGEAARVANQLLDDPGGLARAVRRRSLAALASDIRAVAGSALGILTGDPVQFLAGRRDRLVRARGIDSERIEALVAAREQARSARDYARADELRADLHDLGVEVRDSPRGTTWQIRD